MSRTERLLDLLQVLRRHRYPVTGAALAEELGVSIRTLYRDIATLQSQGARIDGASSARRLPIQSCKRKGHASMARADWATSCVRASSCHH